MGFYIKQLLVAAGLFVAIDSVWISFVANGFYKSQIGDLLAPQPNFMAAAVFYVIYLVAMIVFVINPGFRQSTRWVMGRAALFGLAMYATYDLTNLATLNGWPLGLTIVDLAWGALISTVVATLTHLILRKQVKAKS